jgi:hypothetical protein
LETFMDRFVRLRTLLFIFFIVLFLGPVLTLWACAGEPRGMGLAFMVSGAFIAVLVSGGLANALTEPVLKLTEAAIPHNLSPNLKSQVL